MTTSNSNHVHLGSLLASWGILGVAAVTAAMNFHFWFSRGDLAAALLTVGAECVAAGGFVTVLHHWRSHKLTALGGLIVTALAGGWGALTMTEKLSDEAHQRAVQAAEATPAHAQAVSELALASSLYAGALSERVPDNLGPLTTEARSLAMQRRVEMLKAERDRAQARVTELTPTAALDVKSIVRGWGAMLAVLLGLSVFGLHGRKEEAIVKQPNEPTLEPQPKQLTAHELGKLGAAAKRARREKAEQARLARNAYQREYRARRSGKVPQQPWSPELFGELPEGSLPN